MSPASAAPRSFALVRCSTTLLASDPAKVAEEDLLVTNPGSAPAYQVDYSLCAQLFEEPRVERELERGEEAPKGALLFPVGNCVFSSSNAFTLYRRRGGANGGAPKPNGWPAGP
jgi:hypothetical protein